MRLLGAVLAGGRSRRFGSDKALARIAGRPMLALVAERLGAQTDDIVVAGRDWPGLARVEDVPATGLGPLGGIAGALAHARDHDFDAVLTTSCDLPALPRDLVALLGAPDARLHRQPTIGLWRAGHADGLRRYLESDAPRSVRSWADAIGAGVIAFDEELANINTPADLDTYEAARRPADPRSSR